MYGQVSYYKGVLRNGLCLQRFRFHIITNSQMENVEVFLPLVPWSKYKFTLKTRLSFLMLLGELLPINQSINQVYLMSKTWEVFAQFSEPEAHVKNARQTKKYKTG